MLREAYFELRLLPNCHMLRLGIEIIPRRSTPHCDRFSYKSNGKSKPNRFQGLMCI